MKKNYPKRTIMACAMALAFFSVTDVGNAQTAVTCTPAMSSGCTSGDYINSFQLNAISANNAGCNGAANGYTSYASPVWNLLAGQTYTWSTTHVTWSQNVSIWIDLNNDGNYSANEQVANTSAAALSHNGSFTIPVNVIGGSPVRMRVRCRYSSTFGTGQNEACAGYSFGETEDYFVNVIPPTPCSATPGVNSIVAPNYSICPNNATGLTLSTSYTETGMTYQWYSSTQSSLGIYTSIGSGTTTALSTGNLTQNTWYQVVITCTNAGSSASVSATNLVMVAPVVVDSVPYLENFEGIVNNNQLPNCSWSATSLPNITQTYTLNSNYNRVPHSGNNFASFRYGTGSTGQYFYSNGIYLQAGITYSAGAWYIVDGLLGWQEFSIYYNTSQTSTGLMAIASKTGAVTNTSYQLLSDTFSVPSTGVYYLAVKARDNGSPWYLTWDDLFVNIPCQFNSPSISAVPSTTVACEGALINVNASGADSYYWSNGNSGTSTTYTATSALAMTSIHVTGTRTLSGCSDFLSIPIVVNAAPQVGIIPSTASVCAGDPANLVAFGATTYTWNDLTNNPVKQVKPANSTLYTVIGSNAAGCTGQASYMVNVFPVPNVSGSISQQSMCVGEVAKLEATGAVSYQWMANTAFIQENPAYVSPLVSTSYTVVGTDANGCTDADLVTLVVDACTGLREISTAGSVKLFPNPTTGELTIIRSRSAVASVSVVDVTGRTVFNENLQGFSLNVDLTHLAKGIYYLQVQDDAGTLTEKIIKD